MPNSELVQFRLTPAEQRKLRHLFPARSAGLAARSLVRDTLAAEAQKLRLRSLPKIASGNSLVCTGDAATLLRDVPSGAARCCVTSPPYYRQRTYTNSPDELGQESNPQRYINRLADIFDEVGRVLTPDGTCWIVIDDSYVRKRLVGVPWLLAAELQRRGWWWRAEICWSKASTPESVIDRPTRSHEAVLLFSKSRKYFYDVDALREPHTTEWAKDCIAKARASDSGAKRNPYIFSKEKRRATGTKGITRADFGRLMNPAGRNARDVWEVKVAKHRGRHSAVMPVELAEKCIRAGSAKDDLVIDPFCGTGTTGVGALQLGRRFLGIDVVPDYCEEARARLAKAI